MSVTNFESRKVFLTAGIEHTFNVSLASVNTWRISEAGAPVYVSVNFDAFTKAVQGQGQTLDKFTIDHFTLKSDVDQEVVLTYGRGSLTDSPLQVQTNLNSAEIAAAVSQEVANAVDAALADLPEKITQAVGANEVGVVHVIGDDIEILAGATVTVLAADANRLHGFVNADSNNVGAVRVSPNASADNGQVLEAGGQYDFKSTVAMKVHNPNAQPVTVRVESIGKA